MRKCAASSQQGWRNLAVLCALLLAPLTHAAAALSSNPRAPIPFVLRRGQGTTSHMQGHASLERIATHHARRCLVKR